MRCCQAELLFKEIDCSTDINRIYSIICRYVKEFYPINGVPENIQSSLHLLEGRIEIAEEQLSLTLDLIINEIEKESRHE